MQSIKIQPGSGSPGPFPVTSRPPRIGHGGLGLTVFMVYLMRVSRGEHRTSHYAIATGLMALGMMLMLLAFLLSYYLL